jgi:hypothetical protein
LPSRAAVITAIPTRTNAAAFVFPAALPICGRVPHSSIVIGMTPRLSDVRVTSRRKHRLMPAPAVPSFFVTAGILALSVSLLADAKGRHGEVAPC